MTRRLPPITAPDTAWWATTRRRVFYDAHTPDWTDPRQRGAGEHPDFPVLSQVRPEHDLDVLAAAGADSVVLFAKCQYGNAYYPTAVGRQHAALAGRDLFGEQLAAAHERGMRVIAYYSNMWDTAAAGAHPDWRLQAPGSRGETGRWPALCLLGPYRRFALDQVRELARTYPIDGLWSDILTAGPCVCDRCDTAFRSEYGRSIPLERDDPGWPDLIAFSQKVLREYLAEQRAVLREERPLAALIPNFYATTFVDAVIGLSFEHLGLADIGSSEGYTDWHGLGFPSFAAAYIRAGMLDGPTEVLVSRFVHTWDFTLRSPAQLRFEAFTVAAHGSTVTVDDQPYATGAIEPEVYARLTPIFERIADRAPLLDGAEPVRYAAIWAGQRSRELESILGAAENPSSGEQSAQFPQSEPKSSPSDLVAAVTGTYRSLVESHLPVGFLDERPASLATLADYAAVVLPDVLSLSSDERDALHEYVLGGGGLVVTGPAGVRDARGGTLPYGTLDELLGVRFGPLGRYTYPYLSLTDPQLIAALGTWPVPHYGRMSALEVTDPAATVLATRIDPVLETADGTYWHNNQPAPGPATSDPVVVERILGAGRVIVSAARLGNNRARLGHGAYRDLLAALVVRAAGRDAPVRIAPGPDGTGHHATELVLAHQNDRLIAHLVTGAPVVALDLVGARQPAAIEDVAAVPSLTLVVPKWVRRAARASGSGLVPLDVNGGIVQLERLDDWETVVLSR